MQCDVSGMREHHKTADCPLVMAAAYGGDESHAQKVIAKLSKAIGGLRDPFRLQT